MKKRSPELWLNMVELNFSVAQALRVVVRNLLKFTTKFYLPNSEESSELRIKSLKSFKLSSSVSTV